jgi:hypothetical protein
MRKPRLTIRGMMIGVAMIALMLTGALIARWSANARRLAFKYRIDESVFAQAEQSARVRIREIESSIAKTKQQLTNANAQAARVEEPRKHPYLRLTSKLESELEIDLTTLKPWTLNVAQYSALRRYYSMPGSKYERAARYPWLPVERDPPPPE